MEIAMAKKFVFYDVLQHKIYISKKLDILFEKVEDAKLYSGLFGILDTEIGEVMFKIEESYSGEPIIMDKVMHWESFIKFHRYFDYIEL